MVVNEGVRYHKKGVHAREKYGQDEKPLDFPGRLI